MSEQAKIVIVTGDFTLDWNLALGQKLGSGSRTMGADSSTHQRWQRGGAALFADLMTAVTAKIGDGKSIVVRTLDAPQRPKDGASGQIGPENENYNHSTALWMQHEYAPNDKGHKDEKKKPWRVAEFLGVKQSHSPGAYGAWARVKNGDPHPFLVMLDDAALGFRDHKELWPASVSAESGKPWIVVKTSRPTAKGPLWEHLFKYHAERTIAVMTADDLRLNQLQISRELSCERSAQDLLWELLYNEAFEGLRQCAHVVVSFNAAGAFLYSRFAEKGPAYSIIFDPKVIEGMWEQAHPGGMVGYSSCLAAGIARELMNAEKPNISNGIAAGIHALRALHREGYGERGAKPAEVKLEFPVDLVVKELAVDGETLDNEFATAPVELQVAGKNWTILGKRYPDRVEKIAAEVVKFGAEKQLKGVPFGCFGDLLTVDRQEIESLRSIRALATEYLSQEKPKQPLSIAVFGPPGAGKSFGITQLALALKPGEIEVREFNMSQLRSTDELLSAFHQVRDIGLSGKIPLIFWDEFDSAFDGPFGWLKYFLAPMQDGKFLHGNLPHPIGRAIFVFAGGTSATLDEFGHGLDPEVACAAKLPDFVSRLKGYINVLGPNPLKERDDPHFTLRRAILLRSMLKRFAKKIDSPEGLNIDSGILRALLETTRYKHGARSMESIIAMCRLEGKASFERSALPAPSQLDLHVDGRNFLALVHQPEGTCLEIMAREAHEIYREEMEKAGWKWGPEKSKELKTNPNITSYDKLADRVKEQNRDQVRDIFRKLERVGCSMAPAKEHEPPYEFDKETVELLADLEHTRWMRQMARDDWYWGPDDENKKRHACMLPWHKDKLEPYEGFLDHLGVAELSEDEKNKDRAAVHNIPRILKRGGYTIVPPSKRIGVSKQNDAV